MPKVTDYKAYFKDIATKAGLDDKTIQQVLSSDETFKAFTDGFKPLPDYSHDLDDVRAKTKLEKDAEYKDWHAKELQKYNEYVSGLDTLKQYRDKYGELDASTGGDPNNGGGNGGNGGGNGNGGSGMLSKEDIEKLLDTRLDTRLNDTLSRRDNTYLEYLDLREQHLSTFGKPLDRKAFEAAYKEHPEWGTLQAAYKFWVEPEMLKVTEAKYKADSDRRYQEGVRDGFSRRAMPTDHTPKDFASPMFEQKPDVVKMNDAEQEQHSRQAFFEGLREKQTTP